MRTPRRVRQAACAQPDFFKRLGMTRDRVQTAFDEGIPFVIKMADGEKYKVTDRYRVAFGKTTVVVLADNDMPHVLPLLTMTGISYLKSGRTS